MRATSVLPENYREILSVDLQQNKKLALGVNGAAVVITILMIVLGCVRVPIFTVFGAAAELALRAGVVCVSMVLYIVLHELVHGIAMKCCGSSKVKYGFTGLYAFAGSEDYYSKKAYVFIALAPVVLWGIVLAGLCRIVPESWFWVVYLVQITNISGAAGDYYVTWKFLRLPEDVLVRDSGVSMKVYSAQ